MLYCLWCVQFLKGMFIFFIEFGEISVITTSHTFSDFSLIPTLFSSLSGNTAA